jgi:HlyD family secretion protein
MLKDSLVSQQTYDETFANIKGASSKCRSSRIRRRQNGRGLNNKPWRLVKRPGWALCMKSKAAGGNATLNMSIETIIKHGELALPGYTLFNGYITNSTYFRFTVPKTIE